MDKATVTLHLIITSKALVMMFAAFISVRTIFYGINKITKKN